MLACDTGMFLGIEDILRDVCAVDSGSRDGSLTWECLGISAGHKPLVIDVMVFF
jgi:hypothetical protein